MGLSRLAVMARRRSAVPTMTVRRIPTMMAMMSWLLLIQAERGPAIADKAVVPGAWPDSCGSQYTMR